MDPSPTPDLTPYRRLLIFGGSFDPPHLAHVSLPRAVAKAIDADAIVYMPAGRAPHKLDKQQTDPAHRLAMLRLALAESEPGVATLVLDDEIKRAADGRPSYTVDTLEALSQRIGPDAQMRLLIGTDQVDIFESWYRWERVVELAEPVVMRRRRDPDMDAEPVPSPGEAGQDTGFIPAMPEAWERRAVDVPMTDLSSTAVRRRVASGLSLDGWVPPAVAAYIREHGLYGGATPGVSSD